MEPKKLAAAIAATVARMPQWIRHDLGAQEPSIRMRAEESLAAIIAATIAKDGIDG